MIIPHFPLFKETLKVDHFTQRNCRNSSLNKTVTPIGLAACSFHFLLLPPCLYVGLLPKNFETRRRHLSLNNGVFHVLLKRECIKLYFIHLSECETLRESFSHLFYAIN